MTYVNHGSLTAIGVIFISLTLSMLVLRHYAWRKYPRRLAIDDILIMPSAGLTIAAGVGLIIGTQMNIIGGHSVPAITPAQYEIVGKFQYAFWICHVLTIGFIKLTILFLFRRIFKGRSFRTKFDYANWCLISCVALWTVISLFLYIFACGDKPSRSWTSLQQLRGACMDTNSLQSGCAAFSWIMDLAILLEPLFKIRSLNMKRKRKIQTSFVFLFSIFAVVAGLLRMIIWIQVRIQGYFHPTIWILHEELSVQDFQGAVSIIFFWTYVEIGVGFLVACLPPCAGIMDKMVLSSFQHLRSLSSIRLMSRSRNTSHPGQDQVRDRQGPIAPMSTTYLQVPSAQRSLERSI